MSCAWLVDGWEKHQHAADKSLGFQWILEYTHTHFLLVIDFLPTLWLNADCSNMTPYQEFIPPQCGCDWNVSHSWANTDCIRSLTPLIDRPGQFISHCDSFLYSLGRQGKRRGMQIKSSRNIVHNTYCVLIAGWTVTSRMFSTYLSVCVWACLLFHMHVRLPSPFPQHADKPPNFWKITDFRVEVFEKNKRKFQWFHNKAIRASNNGLAPLNFSLHPSVTVKFSWHSCQKKYRETAEKVLINGTCVSQHSRPLCGGHGEQTACWRRRVIFFGTGDLWLLVFVHLGGETALRVMTRSCQASPGDTSAVDSRAPWDCRGMFTCPSRPVRAHL